MPAQWLACSREKRARANNNKKRSARKLLQLYIHTTREKSVERRRLVYVVDAYKANKAALSCVVPIMKRLTNAPSAPRIYTHSTLHVHTHRQERKKKNIHTVLSRLGKIHKLPGRRLARSLAYIARAFNRMKNHGRPRVIPR